MSYLSTPLERMEPEYDVVVVGSGYGGAIAASRMARAGLRVCLLERGEEWQPGDFPDSPAQGIREIQFDTPDRHTGPGTALFDFRVNPDISVLVGCGLGGTSLINANVSLPPDPRVFDDPIWPKALVDDLEGGFAAGVERFREMVRPVSLPDDVETPAKLEALERSARDLDGRFYRPPIAVTFDDGTNHVGVEQHACNHCGDCVTGCNVGAKNTLAMNYLPDARNHGAEIFTRTAVRRVRREDDHWLVYFDVIDPGPQRADAPEMFVAARSVFLGAGSLGSTEILLRSREHGLSLSDRLGERFTGNGDVLGFAYDADAPVHGLGVRADLRGQPPGPCIAGIIDLRDADDWQRGLVIEEGVIPSTLGPMLPPALALAAQALGRDTDDGTAVEVDLREAEKLAQARSLGAVHRTQTYLVMTHDDGAGRIRLEEDRARIEWPEVGSQGIFQEIDGRLVQATRAIGGTYLKNPAWTERFGNSLVTVHPLGGCPMADSAEEGVVDAAGRVFAGPSGTEVHEGLYVCDGAILPRSVGVNPLLTISALAERICDLAARDQGRSISYDLPSRAAVPVTREPTIGVQFTETLHGYISSEGSDFEECYERGEADDSPCTFTVTVVSDDLDALLDPSGQRARLYGTVDVPSLSDEPLTTTEGWFELLTPDAEQPGAKRMTYRIQLQGDDGREWFLDGFKSVRDDPGFDLWKDTTTLFTTIHEGADASGPVAGRGILKVRPREFARQLRSVRITNAGSLRGRVEATARFGSFFAGSLQEVYGGLFARRTSFDPDAPPRRRRELRAEVPEVRHVRTDDGARIRLTRYRAGERGPVLLSHGLGMSSFVYSLDTVDTNLLEYLQEREYDVWLLDHRASTALGTDAVPSGAHTVARHDLPAALAAVREHTGRDVDVVAHGSGAMAWLMAMIDGLGGVRSLLCSQGALHLEAPRATRLKAGLHLPAVLSALGVESVRAFDEEDGSWQSRLFDAGLRLMPVEEEERCTSEVCRRITFMYGILFEHDQLNAATHEILHELFGVARMEAFDELSRMVREGEIVDPDGVSYVRDLDRLRLPITFMHGQENACFLPEGTARTVELLRATHGPALYRHVEVPDYGAIDWLIGKTASEDVFPHVSEHLERVETDS